MVGAARHDTVTTVVRHPLVVRRLTVYDVARPTPRLARLLAGGPELERFVSLAPDDYVRVFLPDAHTGDLVLPQITEHRVGWRQSGPPPPARHFTPARYDQQASTLQLDIVLHDGGVASRWAAQAQAGQHLGVGGPRESHVVNERFETYLLAADETGLPALARWLRELPSQATVVALIEVHDAEDEQDLETATRCAIRWLHRNQGERLADAVRDLTLPTERLYSWVAAETRAVQAIRHHLVNDRGISSEVVRARSYWTRGMDGGQPPES
jgi:NADPH-dependent ferric siderophore reductase